MSTLHHSRLAPALLAGIAFLTVSACGGDSTTESSNVATVTMSENTLMLRPGESRQLTATPRGSAGSPLSGRTIAWASSAEGVATVSDGLVTAHALGSATITATSEGREGKTEVSVVPPVAAVEVDPPAAALSVGQTRQLAAVMLDAQGGELTGRTVTWSSTNTTVATVSGTGVVTARALGTAQIKATSEGIEGAAEITVIPPDETAPDLATLTIEPDTVSLSGSRLVTVTLRVTDAGAGVQSVTVVLRSPTPVRTLAEVGFAPESGTRQDGTWVFELEIPTDGPLGNWLLHEIVLLDAAGNGRVMNTSGLQTAGFETVVHVRN